MLHKKTNEKEGKNMRNDVTLGAVHTHTHTHTGIFNQLSIKKGNCNFLTKVEVFLSCAIDLTQVFIITKQINKRKEARISA